MRTRHRVWLILLVLACGAAKGSKGPALPDLRIEGADYPFPSGLRILFQRDPTSASTYLSSVIDAGAAQDPAGKEGLAHLVEHLAFRSRAVEGGPTVAERLVAAGASYNAHTSFDVTHFDTVGPANSLALILGLEAERIGKPLQGITEEDLRLEREIVKSELRWRREGRADLIAFDEMGTLLFPKGHAYHRTMAGTDASLDRIALADVTAFATAHYRPFKTTIVVAGPIELAATGAILARSVPRSLLTDKEGPIDVVKNRPPRVDPRSKSTPPAPPSKAIRRVKGPVTHTTVVLAWAVPGGYRDRDALVETTTDALRNAVSTLLYPVYGGTERIQNLSCGAFRSRESTIVSCSIGVAAGEDPEKVATRAIDGVWELWNVDNAEWRKRIFIDAQKNYMRRIYDDALSIDRTSSMAEYLHFTGRADRLALSFADLSTVSGPEVRKLASKWIERGRVAKLIIEPDDGAIAAPAGIAFDTTDPYAGATLGGGPAKARTRPEITAAARASDGSDLSQLTLDNGLKVVVLRRPGAPFVRLGLLTGGGPATFDPWGGTAFLQTRDKAGDSLDIAGIWEEDEYADAALLTLEAPADRLDDALALMKRRVETTRSTFSTWFVQKDVREAVRRWQDYVGRDPRLRATRIARSRLLPRHRLAVSAIDPDSLATLTDGKFEEWIAETLAPENATLFVVGDVDRAVAEEKAIAVWKTWRALNPGAPHRGLPPVPPPPSAREVVIAPAPGRTQAEMSLACRVESTDARSDVVREALAVHLQRMLTLAIRENAGAAYGVFVQEEALGKGAAMLHVRTAVRAEAAAATLELVTSTIETHAAGKADPVALGETLYAMARRTHLENRSNGATLSRLADAVQAGRSPDDLVFRGPWIASVTAADFQKVLAPCAGKEVVTVVGPQAPLAAQLARWTPAVAAD